MTYYCNVCNDELTENEANQCSLCSRMFCEGCGNVEGEVCERCEQRKFAH